MVHKFYFKTTENPIWPYANLDYGYGSLSQSKTFYTAKQLVVLVSTRYGWAPWFPFQGPITRRIFPNMSMHRVELSDDQHDLKRFIRDMGYFRDMHFLPMQLFDNSVIGVGDITDEILGFCRENSIAYHRIDIKTYLFSSPHPDVDIVLRLSTNLVFENLGKKTISHIRNGYNRVTACIKGNHIYNWQT